jgi:hypothetical protein
LAVVTGLNLNRNNSRSQVRLQPRVEYVCVACVTERPPGNPRKQLRHLEYRSILSWPGSSVSGRWQPLSLPATCCVDHRVGESPPLRAVVRGEEDMDDFALTLRLDTPLMQGGPRTGEPDGSGILRGPSVRGLLHQFARALIGPYLKGDAKSTRDAELLLLGSSPSPKEQKEQPQANGKGRPTFRLHQLEREPLPLERKARP